MDKRTQILFKLDLSRSFIGLLIAALVISLSWRGDQSVARAATVANNAAIPSIYHWAGGDGDWRVPESWMPVRTGPASDDVLVFDSGGTFTVVNIPIQTVGQLFVSANTRVDLQSTTNIVLTISGGNGSDLIVEKNSALNFTGAGGIKASLTTGSSAVISGSMTFASTGSASHRLTAIDVGAITFNGPATFTAGAGFVGNPFGTENLNSVVFETGSTYICKAGGDPFGVPQPASVVVFKQGSLFSLRGAVTPSFSGRTYSNFELNSPNETFEIMGGGGWVVDDLTLTAGRLDLYLSGNNSIKGNIAIASGTRLSFQVGTYRFNGTATQFMSGIGTQGAGGGSIIEIDNASGIVLDVGRPLAAWNLHLLNGVVTVTDPTWWVGAGGNVTRTNGHVNGYLRRFFQSPGLYVFDVGTTNAYSPVTVDVIAGVFPRPLTIKAIQGPHLNLLDPAKALSRYWQIFGSGVTADLTFQYSDPLDIPSTANEGSFVIQRYQEGFTQPSGLVDPVANTFKTSVVTDTTVVDWTLAEPAAVGTPTPTSTPTATPTGTPTSTPTATPTASPTPRAAAFDFDADGRSDISVFRPSNGAWYLRRSTAGFYGQNFGSADDRIAPADYDGDGRADIAVYRPSTGIWYITNSSTGTFTYAIFGLAEDLPTPADYDGDRKADISVFRPSTGTWYRQNSSDGAFVAAQFGASGDRPAIGDFDGDGKADLSVFRPSTGAWYQAWSSNGFLFGEQFGISTDKIAPADYDGDGKTDIAIYRPSESLWYVKNSATATYVPYVFGLAADIPVPGDFDGDGKADIGVFRPSDGTWYIVNSSNGSYTIFQFGQNGDRPTQSAFLE